MVVFQEHALRRTMNRQGVLLSGEHEEPYGMVNMGLSGLSTTPW